MVVKNQGLPVQVQLSFHKRYVPEKWYKLNFYQSSHLEATKDLLNIKGTLW